MGQTKNLYFKYLEESYPTDELVVELMARQSEADQNHWEEWLKDEKEKTKYIIIRDFINNFVGTGDLPTFWEILNEHDPSAKIMSTYRKDILFDVLLKVEKKQ